MNLYLLSQTANSGYDTYSNLVVCAESAADAKSIAPDGSENNGDVENDNLWAWTTPEHICVELIGEAKDNLKRGVILAIFHEG